MANAYWIAMQKKKNYEKKLLKLYPNCPNTSGIYFFYREENGINYAYLGQAVKLKDRVLSHIMGYQQHIDISLKKRGLYPDKENGWKLSWLECDSSELDAKEKEHISYLANHGYQLYNKSLGGQGSERANGIGDGTSNKGYRDGLVQGYKNCLKDIKEFFDKYLMYELKGDCYKKDGTIKLTYTKKMQEFQALLERAEDGK